MSGNSNGFTLVELLAIIVILAIIALITTPHFKHNRKFKAKCSKR